MIYDVIESLAKMHRAYFDHFEAQYYTPIHRDRAKRKYVKWAISQPIDIDAFTDRVNYHKHKPSDNYIKLVVDSQNLMYRMRQNEQKGRV